MRAYEVLLWAIGSGWAAWWIAKRPGRLAGVCLATLALVFAVLHVAVEGVRFHMVPTYILLAGLFALSVSRGWSPHPPPRRTRLRAAVAIPVGVWVLLAAALPRLFPVYSYAMPTGPYGIGTATYELKGAPLDRSLVVQAWYPAVPGLKGTPSQITSRTDLLQTAYASFTGLPRPLFDNMRLVLTHAMVGAPMAPATADRRQFPVVLFSHGPLSANRSQSIFQMGSPRQPWIHRLCHRSHRVRLNHDLSRRPRD